MMASDNNIEKLDRSSCMERRFDARGFSDTDHFMS